MRVGACPLAPGFRLAFAFVLRLRALGMPFPCSPRVGLLRSGPLPSGARSLRTGFAFGHLGSFSPFLLASRAPGWRFSTWRLV